MENFLRRMKLSSFEVWCLLCTSAALLLTAGVKIYITHSELSHSQAFLGQAVQAKVTSGLQVVDTLSLTPTLVTFFTWSFVGLIVISGIQSFFKTTRNLKFERDLSSNQYVHPQGFSRHTYWRRVLQDTILSSLLLITTLAFGAFYLIAVLPVAFSYLELFLLHADLSHMSYLALSIFSTLVGTALGYLFVKAIVVYHGGE